MVPIDVDVNGSVPIEQVRAAAGPELERVGASVRPLSKEDFDAIDELDWAAIGDERKELHRELLIEQRRPGVALMIRDRLQGFCYWGPFLGPGVVRDATLLPALVVGSCLVMGSEPGERMKLSAAGAAVTLWGWLRTFELRLSGLDVILGSREMPDLRRCILSPGGLHL